MRARGEPLIPYATCAKCRFRPRDRRGVVAHWRAERSTWGMLAMIMRFVPYIGAFISAIFPLVLAAAVGPGWTMVLMTAALFLFAETVVGQAIEPLTYGHSTGLSPVAVITAATFWTWLWGPIGLILATPLTMCLVVLGRHVDQLKFLEVMFGDEPLTPAELIQTHASARPR